MSLHNPRHTHLTSPNTPPRSPHPHGNNHHNHNNNNSIPLRATSASSYNSNNYLSITRYPDGVYDHQHHQHQQQQHHQTTHMQHGLNHHLHHHGHQPSQQPSSSYQSKGLSQSLHKSLLAEQLQKKHPNNSAHVSSYSETSSLLSNNNNNHGQHSSSSYLMGAINEDSDDYGYSHDENDHYQHANSTSSSYKQKSRIFADDNEHSKKTRGNNNNNTMDNNGSIATSTLHNNETLSPPTPSPSNDNGGNDQGGDNGALVAEEEQQEVNEEEPNSSEPVIVTPLPRMRMIMISFVIMSDAFGYSVMTPFLPFLVRDLKIARTEQQIGYFVGLLVSAVSFAQLFSGVTWGKISDKYGRRPVIIVVCVNYSCCSSSIIFIIIVFYNSHIIIFFYFAQGLLANFVSLLLFGFCKNFWFCLATRILCGLLNGIMPAYKSYIYDSTDDTNQEKGFIIVGVVWGLASILAPALGGYLAPAKKFPFLRTVSIFMEFPYLLAVLIPAILNLIVFFMSLFFLEESKQFNGRRVRKPAASSNSDIEEGAEADVQAPVPAVEEASTSSSTEVNNNNDNSNEPAAAAVSKTNEKQHEQQQQQEEEEEEIDVDAQQPVRSGKSLFYKNGTASRFWFLNPNVIKVLILYTLLSFTLSMFDEIFPLWASNKREFNGLNWDSSLIGIVMSTAGITSLGTLLFYPLLVAKVGILRSYQLMCLVLVVTGVIFPFNSDLAKVSPQALIWVSVAIGVLLRTCCGEICYTNQYVITANSVPSELNGSMNGLASTLGSVGWSLGFVFVLHIFLQMCFFLCFNN